MRKRKLIKLSSLAMRPPIFQGLIFWLALDRFDAVGWVWGAVGAVYFLLWVAFLSELFTAEYVTLRELE